MKLPFDKLVSFLVGLGVPGLVLVVAVYVAGVAGGAAIVVALATLGGPLGMLGGIALLGYTHPLAMDDDGDKDYDP